MAEKVESFQAIEQRYGSENNKSEYKNSVYRQSAVRSNQHSTHQLIDPKYRAHGPYPQVPHQYTHTAIPIKDSTPHNLPPHEFTKSRIRQNELSNQPIQKKPQSYVEWIPYQRKIIDFKDQERIQKKPVKKTITQYREQVRYEEQPREHTGIDYYAVERVKKYVPVQYEQKQYVTVQKMVPYKKTVYVPRTRQVYHGPNPGNLPIYGEGFSSPVDQSHISKGTHSFNPPPSQPLPINRLSENHLARDAFTSHQSHSPIRPSPPKPQNLTVPTPNIFQQGIQQRQQYIPQSNYSTGSFNNTSSVNLMRKYSKNHQIFSNDSYESYVPSFRY